jgi:FkbM family methyltransferase
MNLDNPAWRSAPIRTGFRVAKSLLRRAIPRLSRVIVPYDEGRTSIYADLNTPLGLGVYRYGFRDSDIDLVGRLLSPGDVFVDGGANVGLFTLVAASRVGPTGKVIAFEPGRAVRLRLLENVVLNGLSQVEVIPFALSNRAGEASFRVFDKSGAGLNHLAPTPNESGDLETVGVTTIDSALIPHDRDRLTVIKLDLEGAEHAALVGAEMTLRLSHPDLLLEVEPSHLRRMGSSAPAMATVLRDYGYSFYWPGVDPAGALFLTPTADIASAPHERPNLFATVDPERARRRGVAVR